MNSTSHDREPEPFEPKNLRRSVIAVPLREAIEKEIETTRRFQAEHTEMLHGYSAAVFFRGKTPEEIAASRERVLQRLARAVAELKDAKVLPETEEQLIDELLPAFQGTGSLALLRGQVIDLLLAMDAASDPLTAKGAPAPPGIDHIWPTRFEVIIDINLNFNPPEPAEPAQGGKLALPDSRQIAKEWISDYVEKAKKQARVEDSDQGIDVEKTRLSTQYVFARLEGTVIQELVAIDQRAAVALAKDAAKAAADFAKKQTKLSRKGAAAKTRPDSTITPAEVKRRAAEQLVAEQKRLTARFRTIHHIWPDFSLRSCITQSISTVKADAAHRSFTASGKGITWAVMDSGINAEHPHFRLHKNIDPTSTYHKDFTKLAMPGSALRDEYGHGTHVAGIIAGEQSLAKGAEASEMVCVWRELDETGGPEQVAAKDGGTPRASTHKVSIDGISGIAPQCQLVSLRVLDRFGTGNASNAITAIAHVQEVNHHGRELHIQGVNLSLGYPFDPKWFACGHSPLCVEVNRLVRSGVVVVVAAGNSGYGTLMMLGGKTNDACLDLTINDPGNAEGAITVGSTHREMPHLYGVSYFSSKGPTGDGRSKPDLLAPGEKIVSCASPGSKLVKDEADNEECNYFETSGTSMAAPHVSGAIAAFLSIRKEFIGEPERVKAIFTSTATDLGRDRYFQGAGLLDLMRAIQSV
ncbi:MAG: serine protease AprX [Chthoniobacter sp.]|jgi:subtilisin family serine protease|nr:serine protease AprX [Chthoniobacter sp.]